MVKVIIIRTSGDLIKAVHTLNRMKKRLPRMTVEGMGRWGKILERDVRRSARAAGIKDYSGTLLGEGKGAGIRYEHHPRLERGELFIRDYGVALDTMRPHFVSVHRRRTRLLLWAKLASSGAIQRKALMVEKREIRSFSIFVRPHPFIAFGYRRARSKLRPVLKRLAQRAIYAS